MNHRMAVILLAGTSLLLTPCLASAQAYGPFGPTAGDAFGYTGSRTAGVPFSSIKGAGGTLLTAADPAAATYDDRFYQVPGGALTGFAFPFYGVDQVPNGIYVTTNGFLSFGGTTNTSAALDSQVTASYSNASLASATALRGNMQVDRAFIAPWWDDLQFTVNQAGGIYYLLRTVGGHKELVVEWNNVAFFDSTTDGITMQATLRDDGRITFSYSDTTASSTAITHGVSATFGIHNLGGTTANGQYLQYAVDAANAMLDADQVVITPGGAPVALVGFDID